MNEIIINTSGMMCSGCENRVKNALERVEGVTKVKADHKSGKVSVTCKKEGIKEELVNKIKELGFEVKED